MQLSCSYMFPSCVELISCLLGAAIKFCAVCDLGIPKCGFPVHAVVAGVYLADFPVLGFNAMQFPAKEYQNAVLLFMW